MNYDQIEHEVSMEDEDKGVALTEVRANSVRRFEANPNEGEKVESLPKVIKNRRSS